MKIVMTMMRALLLRTRKDVAHFSLTHTNQRHTCALALEMRESFTSLPRMLIAVAALFVADILSSGEERQLVLTATAAPLMSALCESVAGARDGGLADIRQRRFSGNDATCRPCPLHSRPL